MKATVIFLAILGLSLGAPNHVKISPRSLADDWQDILSLIPLDDIRAIIQGRLQTDGGLANAIEYLQGDEWAALLDEIRGIEAVQNFVQYLTEAGIPVADLVALIHDRIANAVPGVEPDENGSLRPLLDDIEAIIPTTELVALLNDKLQTSEDFQNLYNRISSDDARALVEQIRGIDEVQRLAQRLRDLGVRIDEALAVVFEFLGWGEAKVKIAPYDLSEDWNDIKALIPIDEIRAVIRDRLQTDGALAAVVNYLQGDEWRALVDEVAAKQAVQNLIQYLTDAGLAVSDLIASIRDLIQNAQPGVEPDENGSLRALLDEIEALIPSADLVDLLNEKLENSADVQALYAKISSQDARDLIEEIRQIDEVQRLAGRLRDFGVEVDATLALLYGFLGWGEPGKF